MSSGSGASGPRRHRKQPSLVQKGDDERTFCFVDAESSESDADDALAEEPEAANAILTWAPSSVAGQSKQTTLDAVEEQSHSTSRISEPTAAPSVGSSSTTAVESQHGDTYQSTAPSTLTNTVNLGQDTPSMFPLKPFSAEAANGSYRPARRLRIQPNVQSRQSLLEKTMEQQRVSSAEAISTSATGVPRENKSSAVTPNEASKGIAESPLAGPSATTPGARFDPVAYGAEQRTFRIQSSGMPSVQDFPFNAMSGNDHGASSGKGSDRTKPPSASQARTSDWARAQNLLATTPDDEQQEPVRSASQNGFFAAADADSLADSCHSLAELNDAARKDNLSGVAPTSLLQRSHTNSHSSTSTNSPGLLDNPELAMLSPPETAISTPDLESPPEHALNGDDPLKTVGNGVPRRPSPLRT